MIFYRFVLVLLLVTDSYAYSFDHQYSLWGQVLTQFVKKGKDQNLVLYKGLRENKSQLEKVTLSFSSVKKSDYESWNEKQQMAFLINAYNAFTLKLIVDNKPVKSIKKLGGLFSSPWDIEFFTLLEKKRNLDWIEHKKLRIDFSEPRIHFAINCASMGCPELARTPFQAKQLDSQLESQTISFLSNKKRNKVNMEGKEVHISKIFDWFEKDFKKNGNSIEKFLAKYAYAFFQEKKNSKKSEIIQLRQELLSDQFKIRHLSYDWNLNSYD